MGKTSLRIASRSAIFGFCACVRNTLPSNRWKSSKRTFFIVINRHAPRWYKTIRTDNSSHAQTAISPFSNQYIPVWHAFVVYILCTFSHYLILRRVIWRSERVVGTPLTVAHYRTNFGKQKHKHPTERTKIIIITVTFLKRESGRCCN